MHARIAVAVGDVHVAIRRLGDVGDAVERLAAEQHRTLADLEAGARGAPGLAQHLLEIARGVEDAHRVVAVVGAVQAVLAIDVDAVRRAEDALAPGIEELALLVEDDHRVLAAVEHVDAVLRVDGDARDLDEGPAVRQLLPALDHLILELVRPFRHELFPFGWREEECDRASLSRPRPDGNA